MILSLIKFIFIGFGIFGITDYSLSLNERVLINSTPFGKCKYLTYIINYISLFGFLISPIKKIYLFKFLHSFLMTFSLSLQFTLVFSYWGVYFFNFSLLRTSLLGSFYINLFVDLCQHLFIFLACILEPLEIFGNKIIMNTFLFLFSFGYSIFCYFYFIFYKNWIYLFLEIKKLQMLFFLFIILMPLIFYRLLLCFKPKKRIILNKKNQ